MRLCYMGKNSAIAQCWLNPQIIEERGNKEKRKMDGKSGRESERKEEKSTKKP